MKTIDPLEVYLSEIDYSCSPGGINQWEMSIYSQDHNNYFSGFDNVSQAIEMLMAHYPNREFYVNIRTQAWYQENEERLENVGV